MSALGDVAAALLPPEAGGPEPERVARVARHLIDRMPSANRMGLGAGLLGLEAIALARHRRPLRSLPHRRRARLLASVAGSGPLGSAAVDGIKTLLLLAAGTDAYAAEIAATANREPPVRADPPLTLLGADEVGFGKRWDAIVIGSGAGGAFAARALARAGHSVLVVEEGERWDSRRIRAAHPVERFASLYRDAGATFALGSPPVTLPMGRAVGGTTVVNSGTCFRPPDPVVADWRDHHGLRLAGEELEQRLEDVERTLRVAPVPSEVMGRNGELTLAGAAALGWSSGPLQRNAPGCRGSCQCAIGCPNNAKLGVHLNALPQACEAGAAIAPATRAERILVADGAAVGLRVRTAAGRRVDLPAAKVVVACGAVETPALLRRSGLGGHPRTGRGLSIHPALGASARFAEPVVAWHGVLQSAGVEELHARRGILLEATSTPPGMGSMVMPGFGADLVERIDGAEHLASLGAMIADAPVGRVMGSRRPRVIYPLARHDARRLVEALGAIARVMLAAGAEVVELGGGAPPVRSEGEIGGALAGIRMKALHVAAFHPSGTAAAGADAARHPVAADGALRGVAGVWVADSSILPSCPGVNPQVSVMALASGVGAAAAA